jgi:integrase
MTFDDCVQLILPHLSIRPNTRKNYLGAYSRYLAPSLASLELPVITKNDLIQALSPLPPQSKYQALMVARVIYREALERGIITENIAATIKTPRIEVKVGKFLTWEELLTCDFGKQTNRIRFLALHGLRYGEAVALEPADIYDGQVHITKSKHGATKSKSGVRSVPALAPFVQFARCQNTLAKKLKPYGVTVHSLRKTYAYMLKSSNVHVTTATKLMGHSDPMVTLKIYTLVRNEEIAASGVRLREHFGIGHRQEVI